MTTTDIRPAPHGRYRRVIEGATFSLEANTESVPADGRFYVLDDGEVALATEDFQEAIEEYHRLCREFWDPRLESEDLRTRLSAAWGMLTLDSGHKTAINVITRDGSPQEKKRLDQAQSRRRALKAKQAAS